MIDKIGNSFFFSFPRYDYFFVIKEIVTLNDVIKSLEIIKYVAFYTFIFNIIIQVIINENLALIKIIKTLLKTSQFTQ